MGSERPVGGCGELAGLQGLCWPTRCGPKHPVRLEMSFDIAPETEDIDKTSISLPL